MINDTLRPYAPVLSHSKRYYLIAGGRAGGRSYFASQYATARLIEKSYFRCAIMRYVLGDIRNSIFQEIRDRIEEQKVEGHIDIKEHTLTINYLKNTINGVGFRKSSGDQKAKLKSLANYNCVIIEEADETSEEDFQQLDDSLRTIKTDIIVMLLFNMPDKKHWIMKRWFNLVDSGVEGFYKPVLKDSEKHNTEYIFTTYADNEINLNNTTITNFERYKETKPDHYYNMIKGLVSEGKRGRVFKNWEVINDSEYELLEYPVFYGLDFGFTNDPTALVEIKIHNENIYLRELIYETGLLNKSIADRMETLGVSKSSCIYADNAEPKSIEELRRLGFNILPAEKGQDSIRKGIDLIHSHKVFYTESSVNISLENQDYTWSLDRNKEPTNVPVDRMNHLLDATRYGVYTNHYTKRPNIRLL